MADVWHDLALYESTDLIKRFYERRHHTKLKDAKARAIVSHLAQGRQYFASARQSAEIIRPLIVYYGVLALARGMILFHDVAAQSADVAAHHGLNARQWKETLAPNLRALPNLEITVSSGTFTHFCQVTQNVGISTVWTGRYELTQANEFVRAGWKQTQWETFGTREVPLATTLTVKDILGRIPELHGTFWQTLDEQPQCYLVNVLIDEGWSAQIEIHPTRSGVLPPDEVRRIFQLPEDLAIKEGGALLTPPSFRVEGLSEITKVVPLLEDGANNRPYAIAPLSNSVKLSKLSLLYLASYALGMLARYFPEHWLALIGHSSGDAAYPLLKAALALVEEKVPELIFAYINTPY